jgi:hypothetical protein
VVKDTDSNTNAFLNKEEMEKFKESIKAKTRLSDDHVDKVVELMQTTYTPSKWGLINSITQVAQEHSLERRLELESIAGEMLFAA